MVPIRRNVVLEALGLINQGSASAKPRGSAPWVIDLRNRMFDDGNKQALEAECAGTRRMVKKGRGV